MVSDWNAVRQEFRMEEFADSLNELHRQLVERLETREDRIDREMVGLIEAMQRLDMPPPHGLSAMISIAAAIDAPATCEVLMSFVAGLSKTLREEVAQGTRDPKTLEPLDKSAQRRRKRRRRLRR